MSEETRIVALKYAVSLLPPTMKVVDYVAGIAIDCATKFDAFLDPPKELPKSDKPSKAPVSKKKGTSSTRKW